LPRVALDIDTTDDLALLLTMPVHGRTGALLEQWHARPPLPPVNLGNVQRKATA
jgi:hypothetical protein